MLFDIFLFLVLGNDENDILNDIIIVGEENCRYVNFASTPSGEMFLETSSNPGNKDRIFYDIKEDGSPYFDNNYIYKKESQNNQRFESELGFIKINTNRTDIENELIMSLDKNFIEFFNYKNITYELFSTPIDQFLKIKNTTQVFSGAIIV